MFHIFVISKIEKGAHIKVKLVGPFTTKTKANDYGNKYLNDSEDYVTWTLYSPASQIKNGVLTVNVESPVEDPAVA